MPSWCRPVLLFQVKVLLRPVQTTWETWNIGATAALCEEAAATCLWVPEEAMFLMAGCMLRESGWCDGSKRWPEYMHMSARLCHPLPRPDPAVAPVSCLSMVLLHGIKQGMRGSLSVL